MKFNFTLPTPLQLGAPVSYYEDILSNYRYRDLSDIFNSAVGRFTGECTIGENVYTVQGSERGGLVSWIEILDARTTDSFLDIPLSLPNRKFIKALQELGYTFEHNRDGINISHEDCSIALSYQFGKVVAICWELCDEPPAV